MDTVDQAQKKHTFFTIILAIVYAVSFLIGFSSYRSPALPLGPFVLKGAAVIVYSALVQLVLLALVVGWLRRVGWAFVASLAYQGYGLVVTLANRLLFPRNTDAIMEEAIKQAPENPMFSQSDLLGLARLMMGVTFVFSLIFAALVVLFVFLARKNLEEKRVI